MLTLMVRQVIAYIPLRSAFAMRLVAKMESL